MSRAMAVSSSALAPTMSMPIRALFFQNYPQHLQNMQCKWRCWPLPLQSRRSPPQFRAAASSRRSKGRFSPKPEKLQKDEEDEDDLVDAALESLFSQLEKDLEKDELSDDHISKEEVAKFEEELSELSDLEADDKEAPPDYSELELEDWQLQKLAAALNLGRRKASIKKLATEVGLKRETVLELLRNPPPQLLLYQETESDKDDVESSESESKPSDFISPSVVETEAQKNEPESPMYVNQRGWNTKKRVKKVNIATLEKVYQRTKRPTEAMVINIVQLTKLPRKAIVKWFSDKRSQESTKFVYKKKHQ